jgi:hypothetical protein
MSTIMNSIIETKQTSSHLNYQLFIFNFFAVLNSHVLFQSDKQWGLRDYQELFGDALVSCPSPPTMRLRSVKSPRVPMKFTPRRSSLINNVSVCAPSNLVPFVRVRTCQRHLSEGTQSCLVQTCPDMSGHVETSSRPP